MNSLEKALSTFKDELLERFKQNIFTSEDNVRYCFVNAIKKEYGLTNNNVILEERYNCGNLTLFKNVINKGSNIEMDVHFIIDSNESIFAEIKYHPDNGEFQSTTTENAGALLNDLIRVSSIKERGRKLLVYVFGNEMFKYLNGNFKEKVNFFESPTINNGIINSLAKTAQTKALDNVTVNVLTFQIEAKKIYCSSDNNFFAYVYEIIKTEGESYCE